MPYEMKLGINLYNVMSSTRIRAYVFYTQNEGANFFSFFLHTTIFNSKHICILTYVDLYRNMKFFLEFNVFIKSFIKKIEK